MPAADGSPRPNLSLRLLSKFHWRPSSSKHTRKPSKPDQLPSRSWFKRFCNRWTLIALIAVLVIVAIAVGAWAGTRQHDNATSPNALKGDVMVLYNNDLLGSASNDSYGAILLAKPGSYQDAATNCSSISEQLLETNDPPLSRLLHYLTYLDETNYFNSFWVSGKTGDLCNIVRGNGSPSAVNCTESLQALCSDSAPVSTSNYDDTSSKWHINAISGNQTVTGYRDRRSFRFFGIRFASQPQRFEHSTLYQGDGSTSSALNAGSICVQAGSQGSEDCLFLNIFTPYLPLDGRLAHYLKPVIFFIHGGAFTSGSGSGFDGGNLASRGDVVVVTLNYRLGTLGFLAVNGTSTTGNYGLGDQVTALDWVQEHIRDFGGDPNQITIVGQSAGAASVRALLGSPKAIGKYSAAVMESNLGGYDFGQPYSNYYNLSYQWANFVQPILQDTRCTSSKVKTSQTVVECLQGVSASTIANLPVQAAYLSTDDEYITTPYLILNGSSPVAHVPVMLGTMEDDGVLFIGNAFTSNLTTQLGSASYNESVLSHISDFPMPLDNETAVAGSGPADASGTYNVTARAGTDAMFRCLDQATAYAAANHSLWPAIYYFEFYRSYISYATRPQCSPPDNNPQNPYYKCHSGDLNYVFGNVEFYGLPDRDGRDTSFSQLIVDIWTQFAWHHDPNPDIGYLYARGYLNTLDAVRALPPWTPVGNGTAALRKRILQPDWADLPFSELEQCEDLALPVDMLA